MNLKIDPSPESWAAVQKIIDDKEGACGFVLDKVDVLKIVRGLIDRGFNVRLPTEKIKPMAIPVGIEPEMNVRGQTVALEIKVAGLAITEDMIWLGAELTVDLPKDTAEALAGAEPTARRRRFRTEPTADALAEAAPGGSPQRPNAATRAASASRSPSSGASADARLVEPLALAAHEAARTARPTARTWRERALALALEARR